MINNIKRMTLIFLISIFLLEICLPQTVCASGNSGAINDTKSTESIVHAFTQQDVETFANEILPKQLEKYHIAGATISVVKDGNVLFENGYGFYNENKSQKVSADTTLFKIGSITKLFTWTAVMQLFEEGKINLDKDINYYLKDFKIPEAFGRPITMRNLMTHTTGFDDRLSNLFSSPDGEVIPLGTYLKQNMPKRIYAAGKIIAYSNYGAALAGFIVEQVSGQKYENYIKQNILKPLDMCSTFVEQPVPKAFIDSVSLGFNYNNSLYSGNPDALIQLVPAGAISSTAADMAKFMVAHLNNGELGNARILNEKTTEVMHARQFASDARLPGICLGFMEWNRNGKRIIWHSGGSQLFKSLFMLIPEENIGLFVSYNSPDSDAARTELRQAFLDRYYPYEYEAPQQMVGYKERSEKYEGTYNEARTALYNSDKLIFALSRAKKVTANEDGSITFRDTKYVEVEPLVFNEIGGQGILIFKQNEKGDITNVYQDFEPHETYIKLPWYETNEIQMFIFAICLLTFLYVVLGWAIIRRSRRENNWYTKDEHILTFGRKLIWWTCLFDLVFPVIAALGVVLELVIGASNLSILNIPVLTKVSLFVPVIASVLGCVAFIYAIYAWKNRVWSFSYRFQYTLVLITSIIFTCWLKYWNLLGFYL